MSGRAGSVLAGCVLCGPAPARCASTAREADDASAYGGASVNIFDLREQLVTDYGDFIRGFLKIRDPRLDEFVHRSLDEGVFWPEPYISLNPNFASGGYVDELVDARVLDGGCATAFRRDKD